MMLVSKTDLVLLHAAKGPGRDASTYTYLFGLRIRRASGRCESLTESDARKRCFVLFQEEVWLKVDKEMGDDARHR
jgi:hypothetical protein